MTQDEILQALAELGGQAETLDDVVIEPLTPSPVQPDAMRRAEPEGISLEASAFQNANPPSGSPPAPSPERDSARDLYRSLYNRNRAAAPFTGVVPGAQSFGVEDVQPPAAESAAKPEQVIAVRVGTPGRSDTGRGSETKVNIIDPKTRRVKLMQG